MDDREQVNYDNSTGAYFNPVTLRDEVPLEFKVEFERTREVYDMATAVIYAHTWEEADKIACQFARNDEIEHGLNAYIDTDYDYEGGTEAWYASVDTDKGNIEEDRESAKKDIDLCRIENEHLWGVPYADLRS